MNIDIICPIYNGSKYIEKLNTSILKQKKVRLNKVYYVLTESIDNSQNILDNLCLDYFIVSKENFSHSYTRETIAKKCNAEIIVFISQDIQINSDLWLYYLTKDISNGECDASYSRQISNKNNIEKYFRELNYPNHSFIKTKNDIENLGLNTFFFSDASSAINNKIFQNLNYYDGKKFSSNEDQYIAYKLIMNNYRIKYCSKSVVNHSHDFKLKSLFLRYRDTGKFYRDEPYMNNYGTNKSGLNAALYIFRRSIEEKNYVALIEFLPNMLVRFIGLKIGLRSKK